MFYSTGIVTNLIRSFILLTVILVIIRFSITHSLFHSWLKTFFFCKSFPPQSFFFFFRSDYMDSPQTFAVTSERIRFYFLVFLFYTFSCWFRALD